MADSYVEQGEYSFQQGFDSMKKIYEENEILPTAVMVGNDVMAIGAIEFLEQQKCKVPEDISIMGFDDIEFASYFKPQLTTVRVSYFEEGKMAVEKLFQRIHCSDLPPTMNYVPHKIIRRNSVKQI